MTQMEHAVSTDNRRDAFLPGLALVLALQLIVVIAVPVVGLAIAMAAPLAGISAFFLPLAAWGPAQIVLIAVPLWRAVAEGRVRRAKGICAGAILVCVLHAAIIVATTYAPPWE